MLKKIIQISLIVSTILTVGCKKKSIEPQLTLPNSQILLRSEGEILSEISFSACDKNPSPSESIGANPSLLLFSPGIFLPEGIGRMEDQIGFDFVFHGVDVAYLGSPSNEEFWEHLGTQNFEFNEEAYKRDFFLKITQEGKVFQNWWNGDLLSGFGTNISQDETGLQFKNTQFTKFKRFGDTCGYNFEVLRMQGEIEGILITEDRSDTLSISGNLDLFLHISEK